MTSAFVVYLAIVANLAWATALDTSTPWYSPAISVQAYSVAFLAGTVLAIFLCAFATQRASALAAELRSLNLGIVHLFTTGESDGLVSTRGSDRGASADPSIQALVATLPRTMPAEDWSPVGSYARTLELLESSSPTAVADRSILIRQLLRERRVLRDAIGDIWRVVAGPVILGVAFTAIAGPMLPGSAEFAQTNFQLNTALILFLMYGFSGLLAWALVAIARVHHSVVAAN